MFILPGCYSFKGITPITATIQLKPSDVKQAKSLGKTCCRATIFGGFGNISIKEVMDESNASKITFVDYDFSIYPLWGTACMTVYGY